MTPSRILPLSGREGVGLLLYMGRCPKPHFLIWIRQNLFVHFLFAQKMNQKRAPETTTSEFLSARYTGHEGATKKTEVRTVSGFSDAPSQLSSVYNLSVLGVIIIVAMLSLRRYGIKKGLPSLEGRGWVKRIASSPPAGGSSQ